MSASRDPGVRGGAAPARTHSLVGRITLVTTCVAVLAVLVTAALSFQLLRHDALRLVGSRDLGPTGGSVGLLARRLVIGLAAGLVIAVAAAGSLARRIAQPLSRTAVSARRIADGERGVAIASTGVTEVDDVAHALVALDSALSTSEARQREFLLSVSHEMRTPITAIRGYAEAMRDEMIPTDDVPEVGSTLVEAADRLDHFVRDLLELARLESDDFRLDPQPVDLETLVESAVDAWSGLAATLQVRLQPDLPRDRVHARADPMRLRQVVDGLIENALRVSPPGSTLDIWLRGEPGHAVLTVRDHGPGLSAADVDVAFERGVLHERYRDARPVGTGLGLSIAHRLAARMQVSLTAGPAEGGGAAFTLTIPLAARA